MTAFVVLMELDAEFPSYWSICQGRCEFWAIEGNTEEEAVALSALHNFVSHRGSREELDAVLDALELDSA